MNTFLTFLVNNGILILVLLFFFVTFAMFRMIGVKRIADGVTRNPVLAIMISVILIGVLGIGLKNIKIDADVKSLLPRNMPCHQATTKLEKTFGSIETAFISVEAKNGTVWTPEILEKVRDISNELKKAPYVNRIISLSEGKEIVNKDEAMVTQNIMDEIPATPEAMNELRERVKSNTLLADKIVSKDDTVTLIIIELKLNMTKDIDGKTVDIKINDDDICKLDPADPSKPSLENIQAKYRDENTDITLSGYTYIRYDTMTKMVADMMLFLPFSILVMLGFLFLCFRSIRGMLLPFTVVVLSLTGLYGFIGWTGEKIYLPYIIIGPMFIAIAHNYGTQLIANYYEDVQDMHGKVEKREIAESGIVKMGTPIFLSVATVVIGFISMIGHPLSSMALLGVFSSFGIIIAFILTLILTPAILSLLNVPKMLVEKRHGILTDKILERFSTFIIRFKIPILAVVVAVIIVCAVSIPFINVDSNMLSFYKKGSPVNKAFNLLGNKFSGGATINVLLESENPVAGDSDVDGIMKSPAVLKWMDGFQKSVKSLVDPKTGKRMVGDAYSLSDMIAYMNKIMQKDDGKNVVPDDPNLIAQYLLLYEMSGGNDLADMVDFKYNNAQMVIMLPEMGTQIVSRVVRYMENYIKNNPPPGVRVTFGGTLMYTEQINPMLIDGQTVSIIVSIIAIIFCYMLVFRSFTAGLLSSIPLIVATLLVFGLMALFRINLDFVTTILTSIMIGAGTDYTAYFLWRMRELTGKYGDIEKAYKETMGTIGKGIIFNGFSVVIGFVVFFWSNFVPIIFFGFLISISIFVCIIGALSILPIAILLVKPKFLFK
jgi:uncharacterized protein